MVRLLSEGRIWVKLSGLANISDLGPTLEDARAIHEALLAANPEQLVWGSDWPHTKPAGMRSYTDGCCDGSTTGPPRTPIAGAS